MQDKPMIECMYGWGQTLRLYQDHLEVNGTFYQLDELVSARPLYRRVFGVSSARLELRFRRKALVLRGIAPLESAGTITQYLHDHYTLSQNDPAAPYTTPEMPANAVTAAQPALPSTNQRARGAEDRRTQDVDIGSYESLQAHA